MDTRKLDEGSRRLGAIRWSALATGAVIAVALQTLLLLLGVAVASSVGDRMLEGGYSLWAVLVQLVAMAVGGALTARLSDAVHRTTGAAAGVMTWALTLVLGIAVHGLIMGAQLGRGAWAGFVGASLSLAAAIAGGMFGTTFGRPVRAPLGGTPVVHAP